MLKTTKIFFLFLSVLLVSVSPAVAQENCEDLSCVQYLLAADPKHPEVAAYIRNNGGTPWITDNTNPEDIGFKYWTESMAKNSYWEGSDFRHLISKVVIRRPDVLKKVLPEMGYFYHYDEGINKRPEYHKIQKKYNSTSIELSHDPFYEQRNNFSDCWYGSIKYRRNETGEIVATEINFEFRKSDRDKAIEYNPVGWHTYDQRLVCETGNCVICGVGKLQALEGVTVKDGINYEPDEITLEVSKFKGEMPLGLSTNVSYKDLVEKFGPDYPWEDENIYSFHTAKKPIRFYFENGTLTKIVSCEFQDCKDNVPVQQKVTSTIVDGCETLNSPGVISYSGGIMYYGERKNGLPHGYGLLKWDKEVIYATHTYFNNGKKLGFDKPTVPVCLSRNCDGNGTMLTHFGVYQGQVKDGKPHGKGKVIFGYDWNKWHGYSGDFVDGEPGPLVSQDEKPKPTGAVKFNPEIITWEKYWQSSVDQYHKVKELKAFMKYGNNFGNTANACGKDKDAATMYFCLTDAYNKLMKGKVEHSGQSIKEVWDVVYESTLKVSCYEGLMEFSDARTKARKNMDDFYFMVNNVKDFVEAATQTYKVKAVENDPKLARQMFPGTITAVRGNLTEVETYFEKFVEALDEMDKVVKKYECTYNK